MAGFSAAGVPSDHLGADEGIPADLTQGGNGLLVLPGRALLLVCQRLGGTDLVRLGLVCRGLRGLARRPRAWQHVHWSGWREQSRGVLRVAPALRRVSVNGNQATLRLLRRATERVQEFELENEQDGYTNEGDEIDMEGVFNVLEHYRGHLQVVRFGTLWSERVLDAIDGLGIKELYVGSRLAKTYPGSTKVVKKLSFWQEASGEVACRLVRAARATLESFHVDSFRMYKNPVACSPEVASELQRCSALRSASIPTWKPALLSAFPNMQKLCLYEFGYVDHAAAKRTLQAATGRSKRLRLESLTLSLGHLGHRGLVKHVAEGCPALRTLCLRYKAMSDGSFQHDCQVDVARDLHAVLAPLTQLHTLTLEAARVPCSVFRGLERGALPSLQVLELKYCGVTPKGREALGSLTAHRAGLAVTGGAPRVARLDREGGGFGGWAAETRCRRGDCQDQSDCEDGDDDPVPAQQDEDEDSEEEEEDFESFRQPRPGESMLQLLDRLATRYVDPVLDELMNAPSDSD